MRVRAAACAAVLGGIGATASGCGDAAPPAPARAAAAPETARPAADARRFESVDQAVHFIARRLETRVPIPAGLPANTRLASDPRVHAGEAQLTLALPHRRVLTIQYGRAEFDGCGPLHPRKVSVAGVPAVLNRSRHRGRTFTALVWPATRRRPEGRYGLSGEFTAARMLRFAESMQTARRAGAARTRRGC